MWVSVFSVSKFDVFDVFDALDVFYVFNFVCCDFSEVLPGLFELA